MILLPSWSLLNARGSAYPLALAPHIKLSCSPHQSSSDMEENPAWLYAKMAQGVTAWLPFLWVPGIPFLPCWEPPMPGGEHWGRNADQVPVLCLMGNSPGSPDEGIGVFGMFRSQTQFWVCWGSCRSWGVLPRGTHMTPCVTVFRGEPGQARAQPGPSTNPTWFL